MDNIVNMLTILSATASISWALVKLSLRWSSSRWSSSQPVRVPVRVEVSSRRGRYQRWDE